jgi:ribose/xylose/arabinose/galactoside ABC-type transport system permease subunit
LQSFTRARPLGLSWIFFIFIAIIILMDLVLRKTRIGYQIRAVGGNREAAEMAGIGVKNVKLLAFIIAGLLSACSGLFDTLMAGAASDVFGSGREFRAITCCAIGGISMAGGAGSIYGVGLGVLLFHTLWYCLRILAVNTNLQLVFIGIILILAVLLDLQRKRVETRKLV